MTTSGRITSCSAKRSIADGSASSTEVSSTYVRPAGPIGALAFATPVLAFAALTLVVGARDGVAERSRLRVGVRRGGDAAGCGSDSPLATSLARRRPVV